MSCKVSVAIEACLPCPCLPTTTRKPGSRSSYLCQSTKENTYYRRDVFHIDLLSREKVPNSKVWQIHFLPEFSAAQCDSGKCVHLPKCVQSHLAKPHGRKQNSKFFSLNSFKTHHVETHDTEYADIPKLFTRNLTSVNFEKSWFIKVIINNLYDPISLYRAKGRESSKEVTE